MQIFLHKSFITTCLLMAGTIIQSNFVSAQHNTVAGWYFPNGSESYDPAGFWNAETGSGAIYFNGTNGSSEFGGIGTPNGQINPTFTGTTLNTTDWEHEEESFSLSPVGSNNNGRYISFTFSMEAKKELIISFATRGTSTGYNSGLWEYSTDGTTWAPLTGLYEWSTDEVTWNVLSDGNTAARAPGFGTLSATSFRVVRIATGALDYASNAYLRYQLSGATSTSGNNRLDNIRLEALDDVPMNITLGHVTAYHDERSNIIEWESLKEEAGDHYVVEKSNDSRDFEPLEAVPALGNAPSYYRVEDHYPSVKRDYYRIRLNHSDGTHSYSKIVTVHNTDNRGRNGFIAGPNPAHHSITVSVSNLDHGRTAVISVMDSKGVLLHTQHINENGTHLIDINSLSNGLLYINYSDGTISKTQKIMKY